MSITKSQLSIIAPTIKEPNLTIYTDALNVTMKEYSIESPSQKCMFLAQVLHESGACRYVKELASGSAYEGRKDLGNTQVGDGIKFKGRGLIQVTGRANYTRLGEFLKLDLLSNPEILEKPELASKSAGWFWHSRKLNTTSSVNTVEAFLAVTKKINGGTNGLEDRTLYWNRAKKVFGI